MRAWIALGLCLAAVAGCGGDDDEGERQPVAPAPAAPGGTEAETAPAATGPERAETAPSPEDQPGGAGDEEPVRVEAVFTGEGGRVTPARVEVPAYIAVQIILKARDDEPYVLEIGGRSLRPGDTLDLDGLRPGERVVGSAGGRRVVVSATAEPGP